MYTDILVQKMREDKAPFALYEPLNDLLRFRGGHAYNRVIDAVKRVLGEQANFRGCDECVAEMLALAVFNGEVDIRDNGSLDKYVEAAK